MKVAFWNGISSSDSVANYVAAVGMMLAFKYNCNVVLSSNYISNRMMQDCFSRRMMEEGIAHTPYCFLYGTPEYYGALWKMKRNRQHNILEMPMKRMKIIYPPDIAEKSMFYHQISSKDFYLLSMAKSSIAESKNVLDEAELVVVFLSQNEPEIQNFFERFSSLIPKAFFVIVDNQREAGHACRKLKSEYGIKHSDIGIIPHNSEFEQASEDGNMGHFILHNIQGTMEEQNNNFIVSLRKVSKTIYMRGINMCNKEQEDDWKS